MYTVPPELYEGTDPSSQLLPSIQSPFTASFHTNEACAPENDTTANMAAKDFRTITTSFPETTVSHRRR
jgi:hypothetical protein